MRAHEDEAPVLTPAVRYLRTQSGGPGSGNGDTLAEPQSSVPAPWPDGEESRGETDPDLGETDETAALPTAPAPERAGIRFLTRRLDIAEVADPSLHHGTDQVFFGATVTYANAAGEERTVTIKGIDEADSLRGEVSWISPIARALLKAREGDQVQLVSPGGVERIEVLAVRYPAPGQENR